MKLFGSKFFSAVALLTLGAAFCLTGCDELPGLENVEGQDIITTRDETVDNNGNYSELSEGDTAPDFTAELVDGSKFVLSENSGKVVLINLWATWCGPCVEEMPAFEKLNKEYGDDVQIVCVNCMEPKSDVDSFVKENGYTFPIAYDESGAVSFKYPTQGIPYTLVVGKDGKVKNIYVGSMGMEEQYSAYKDAIDAALAD
ncbi:MAG: TlpA family protein disulfide reductase [Lachnospiraceae bacterium]|nr:TlpA family protein disulfide reductase [Lachnospiraceae bacterium]